MSTHVRAQLTANANVVENLDGVAAHVTSTSAAVGQSLRKFRCLYSFVPSDDPKGQLAFEKACIVVCVLDAMADLWHAQDDVVTVAEPHVSESVDHTACD